MTKRVAPQQLGKKGSDTTPMAWEPSRQNHLHFRPLQWIFYFFHPNEILMQMSFPQSGGEGGGRPLCLVKLWHLLVPLPPLLVRCERVSCKSSACAGCSIEGVKADCNYTLRTWGCGILTRGEAENAHCELPRVPPPTSPPRYRRELSPCTCFTVTKQNSQCCRFGCSVSTDLHQEGSAGKDCRSKGLWEDTSAFLSGSSDLVVFGLESNVAP